MNTERKQSKYRLKKSTSKSNECHCCRGAFPFCWRCRCGFSICQDCMDENVWGMSCNMITWQCPDCGDWNGFGNQ